jgi:hypothetical protein
MVRCALCGGEAFRGRDGKLGMHTTAATGGKRPREWQMFDAGAPYVPAEVCKGSEHGARP